MNQKQYLDLKSPAPAQYCLMYCFCHTAFKGCMAKTKTKGLLSMSKPFKFSKMIKNNKDLFTIY